MATFGPYDTTNQYIKYKIYVTTNSQSIANNTSSVTVKVQFYRTNTGYTTYGSGTVYCKIDGKEYTASVDSSDKITNSGIYLFNKTVTISHDDDGKKNLYVYAKISHSQFDQTSYKGTYTALTTIARKSTLSVANGTLGTKQTLTVTRKASSLTHTITYTCGSASGTICTKSSSTSMGFVPPITLSSQNTTGTSVSITYKITTYSGSTSVGSNSYTKTCSIPSSVKPNCSILVTDPTGYADKYGGFIKGLSKIKVTISATKAYGSAIASYSTTANGSKYTGSTVTTGVLKSTDSKTVSSTVKDKRGRTSDAASVTIVTLAYSKPSASKLVVGRCDEDGTPNDKGAYVQVTASGSVTSLNSKNTGTYTLSWKKSTDSSYPSSNTVTLASGSTYSISNKTHIFAADTDSSYDIRLQVKDAFYTTTKTTSASTAFTLLHFTEDGTGLAVGKLAEESDTFDVGVPAIFREGVANKLLWSGGYYMTGGHIVSLSEPVSKQLSGICLVFSYYEEGAAQNYYFHSFFVPKYTVSKHSGCGYTFIMSSGKFGTMCTKYLYITDNQITGNDVNGESGTANSGITFANNTFVLRYVIGV